MYEFRKSKDLIDFFKEAIDEQKEVMLGDEHFGLTKDYVKKISDKLQSANKPQIINTLLFVLRDKEITEFQKGYIISTLLKTFAMLNQINSMMAGQNKNLEVPNINVKN